MKEHLNFKPVEGVQVAIAQKENELNEYDWSVFILNRNKEAITNVIIVTKGYGLLNGEEKKTSVLRHHLEEIPEESFAIVEPIQEELFQLSNEFWVSYFIGNQIFDKKFVFVAGSISESNLMDIPFLNMKGVLHS